MRLLLSTSALAVAAVMAAPNPSHAIIALQTSHCCAYHPMQPMPHPVPPKPTPMPMKPVHWGGSWGGGHGTWGGGHATWGGGHAASGMHPMGMHYYGMGTSHGFYWRGSGNLHAAGGYYGHAGTWGSGSKLWGSNGYSGGASHMPSGTHAVGMHYYGMSGGSLAARYGKIERFLRPVQFAARSAFYRPTGLKSWGGSKPKPGAWHVGMSYPTSGSGGYVYRVKYGYKYSASYRSYGSGGSKSTPTSMPSTSGSWGYKSYE